MNKFLLSLIYAFYVFNFVWCGILFPQTAKPQTLKIIFLDVGQGDSALILGPNNSRYLIDGGPDFGIDEALKPYVHPFACNFGFLLLSHAHADHSVGLERVQKRCDVNTLFSYSDATNPKILQIRPVAGQKYCFEGFCTKFLWPPAGKFPLLDAKNENLHSLVFLLTTTKSVALFGGDAEIPVWDSLKEILKGIKPNLFKVSHHGAENGLATSLLKNLKPSVAIISVGNGNTYGHPSPKTLDFFKSIGTKVFRTDFMGSIETEILL